jgi:tetraprenyl-beta-curcumene synthase
MLHEALHAALSPGTPHPDYYAHHAREDDGGYLRELVDACRSAVELLPSWARVADRTRAMSRLVIEFQALNHADRGSVASGLAAFAAATPSRGTALCWWEAAAGGASSLVVFSLLAAAARPSLSLRDAEAIEHAYVPWIGALHVLLDSLVDRPRDLASGHHSLVAHYRSSSAMAIGMGAIADAAVHAVRGISLARDHELLLVAMAGLYLTRPAASLPYAAETSARILDAFGDLAAPVRLMHRTRERVARTPHRN